MVFRPLTLLADWMDTAGGMLCGLILVVLFPVWDIINARLRLGRTGKTVLAICLAAVGVSFTIWFFHVDVPGQLLGRR